MTDFKIESAVFIPDPALFRDFKSSPDGVIGRDLRRRGRKLIVLSARSVHKRSGSLARSISMRYVPSPNPIVIVGSNKRYAYFLHEGTEPHLIRPKPGRTMRFKVKGRIVYAQEIKHPGTRPTKFLSRHLVRVVND